MAKRAQPTSQDQLWQRWFKVLADFVTREGHARVPARHREADQALGGWVATQRARYWKGKLSVERATRLEALPGWAWRLAHAPARTSWDDSFTDLRAFVVRHGHARVPQVERRQEGRALGVWASVQRHRYSRGLLSEERQRRLESLPGWVWAVDLGELWEERFQAVAAYAAREGHSLVPQRHIEDGRPLGVWVANQRLRHKEGRLAEERRRRLERLR